MRFPTAVVRCATAFLLLAAPGMATTTWDLVTNFNAPNNGSASSVFSYGGGGTPGTFVAEPVLTPNCIGTPTFCYSNGGSFPTANAVLWNGTNGNVFPSGSTTMPNTVLYMDPESTAGIIVRFTAPVTDVYSVNGAFTALDSFHHTTDGSVYANGVLELGPSAIGSNPSTVPISLSGLSLTAGQTIDFIVFTGSDASFLATGLAGTITGSLTQTPEPGSFFLMAGAAFVIAGVRRMRRSR